MTIQNIIDELAQEVGGQTSDASLESILFICFKVGLRRVPVKIRTRILVQQGSLSVPAQVYEYPLSSLNGFIRERAIWYLDSNSIRVPILPHRSVQDFHNKFNPNYFGKPARYLIYNNSNVLYIQFNHQTDVPITVGLDYFISSSNVTLNTTFMGDEQLVECIKGYAMERYYRNYEEDKQKADDNRDEAKDLMLQIEGDYEAEELAGYIEDCGDY